MKNPRFVNFFVTSHFFGILMFIKYVHSIFAKMPINIKCLVWLLRIKCDMYDYPGRGHYALIFTRKQAKLPDIVVAFHPHF